MSKTIQINPSLFNNVGSLSKTKKIREKKQKPTIPPLITPNALKNKLLKRIKEHKKEETSTSNREDKKNTISDIGIYTDEFNDSIEYLKHLSTFKKAEQHNQNKTMKNYTSPPHVQLDFPDILKEDVSVQNFNKIETPIALKQKLTPDPPYGCLKGGSKPTYRSWNTTQKIRDCVQPNLAFSISTKLPEETEREKRLNILKEKIKNRQQEKTNDNVITNTNLIQTNRVDPIENNTTSILEKNEVSKSIEEGLQNKMHEDRVKEDEKQSSRRLIKKTIHRKYTIGKSKIHGKVGVLIKDRNTRKHVLNSQMALRKKPINDVKLYLREHALLKAGSNAPNDVVRKIYESSMLAGEITNNNKDILLHNFLKDKDSD